MNELRDSGSYLIETESGDRAVVSAQHLAEESSRLVASMLTIGKITGNDASADLRRLYAETRSFAYIEALARETVVLATAYTLEAAEPFHVGIILNNLKAFILEVHRCRDDAVVAVGDGADVA